jgi:hypothetical protein
MQPATNAETDALLFLPGVGQVASSDETTLAFAARVATALDHGSQTPRAIFRVRSRVEEARQEVGDHRFLVCQILRVEPDGAEKPVLDVYKLDYQNILVKDYEQQSSFRRAAVTAFQAGRGALRIVGALRRSRAISARRLLQVLTAFFLWILLSAYFLLLLASLLAVASVGLERILELNQDVTAPGAGEVLKRIASFSGWLSGVAILATVLTSFVPERWKNELVGMGASYVRMSTYLSINQQRSAILGRFHALLEHIAEKEVPYRRVHVVAYSFGSVVALDALFPPNNFSNRPPHAPRLEAIDKLVTIGCPFDFIRALWPRYFEGRVALSDAPRTWFNVYTPADAFGSNFRDDDALGEATVSLAGKSPNNLVYEQSNYGILDALTFVALRAHGMYFSPDGDHLDQGCLRETISAAFAGEPILA